MVRPIRGNKKRGRPRTTGPGVQIGMRWQTPELNAIDAWRRAQPDKPSRTVAIRRLVNEVLFSRKASKSRSVALQREQLNWRPAPSKKLPTNLSLLKNRRGGNACWSIRISRNPRGPTETKVAVPHGRWPKNGHFKRLKSSDAGCGAGRNAGGTPARENLRACYWRCLRGGRTGRAGGGDG